MVSNSMLILICIREEHASSKYIYTWSLKRLCIGVICPCHAPWPPAIAGTRRGRFLCSRFCIFQIRNSSPRFTVQILLHKGSDHQVPQYRNVNNAFLRLRHGYYEYVLLLGAISLFIRHRLDTSPRRSSCLTPSSGFWKTLA